ncbi:flagellar protein FlaG [Paenibacillus thailandensis]|uniref:Flagellar protein FlaG n=1 Tax=Paenibacillus thailandensis TaxID=393250 RepID=A0ABW5R2S4_9BACL
MTMNVSSINTKANIAPESYGTNVSYANSKETDKATKNTAQGDQELSKAVSRALEAIQEPNTRVERVVHEATNHIVYKVTDAESGKVIREIPEEKLLDMAAKLMELSGQIIDKKV